MRDMCDEMDSACKRVTEEFDTRAGIEEKQTN